ncbi:unnamed protein product, partial [Prorocentrum cordatum]
SGGHACAEPAPARAAVAVLDAAGLQIVAYMCVADAWRARAVSRCFVRFCQEWLAAARRHGEARAGAASAIVVRRDTCHTAQAASRAFAAALLDGRVLEAR